MYKTLNINGMDYKLEYTIEASLYKDGIDRLMEFLSGAFGPASEKQITKGLNAQDKTAVRQQLVNNMKTEITSLPNTALMLFYMGLLEYHGPEGDGLIRNMKDAKKLAAQLFAQKEDEITDWAALLSVCLGQMGEDGFFKLTGLEKILAQNEEEKPKANRAARRAVTKHSEDKF